jgi:uncharacterized membrane protein
MMRKSWTKWILIAVIALALIVGVPIIINECYKTNSGYMTIWGAADALSYYGTILGALVAVATVVVTILFTYKQIQCDSYLRRENEKWFDVESVFSNALNTINLMPPLIETMRFKMYSMQMQSSSSQLGVQEICMIRKHSHRNRGPLGKRVAVWNGDRDRGGGHTGCRRDLLHRKGGIHEEELRT